ncbi:RDD family protein [Nocardiopsis lambiniae]|uniref:RDD family protein n=1 Tax=Nocardiopsis lambiniae TaxID=3075539 RepID=A0ABU2M2I0_9ACTN|nr:RDD family protein [Nocardiopsis sp. DSM 44743]MDT0326812.1 RDD family protein [Nocardiopsis sp. DSM 44743]
MSGATQVDALAVRIHAIDWNGNLDHTRSRVLLMREYLRRMALWTRTLDARGWPFYDLAEFAAPGIRATDEVLKGVKDDPDIVRQFPTVGKTCVWALHLAAARDAGASLPDLPDPFEPLIRMYERGGGFSLSTTGTIDIDGAGIHRGTLLHHLGDTPKAPETDTELNALDDIGREVPETAPNGGGAEEAAPARRYAGYTITATPATGEGEPRVLPTGPTAPQPEAPSAKAAVSEPPPSGDAPPTAPAITGTDGGPPRPQFAPPGPPAYATSAHPTGVGPAGHPVPGAPYGGGGMPPAGTPAHGHPPFAGYPVPPAGYPVHPGGRPGYPVGHPGSGYGTPVVRLSDPAQWDPNNPTVGLADSGQRFLARFLDTLAVGVLWFLSMMASTLTAVAIGGGDIVDGASETGFAIGYVFSFFLLPILWEWFQVSVWGRSLGKIALGLWVVPTEGGKRRLPAGRALLRALCFAPGVFNLVNLLLPWSLTNVLWHLRDKQRRQCLHDRFSRSVVVQTSR